MEYRCPVTEAACIAIFQARQISSCEMDPVVPAPHPCVDGQPAQSVGDCAPLIYDITIV